MVKIVIDTNIMVSGLISPDRSAREVIRRCLQGQFQPLMGNALFLEMEDVVARKDLFEGGLSTQEQRDHLFNAFLSCCDWIKVSYLWRPNLPDEADNHLIELAMAGRASHVVSGNTKHLKAGQLRFEGLRIVSPRTLLDEVW